MKNWWIECKKKINDLNNYKILTMMTFVLILIGFIMQFRLVGMYYDDYGNASLSYGYDSSHIRGTDYTLNDLLTWAKWIYFNWSGRVLYALFLIPLLKSGSDLYMFVEAIVLTLIFVYMYKIVKRYAGIEKDNPLIVIGFVIMYGLLYGTILNWGIYWASASVLYLLPVLPFLIFIEMYDKVESKITCHEKVTSSSYLKLFLLIPLITLSQEQVGGAFLVWLICRIVLGHIKTEKKYLKLDILVVLWTSLTFIIMFGAPGNWVRMNGSGEFAQLSLFGKVKHNLPILLMVLVDGDLIGINTLLWVSGVLMISALCIITRQKRHIFWFVGIIPYGYTILERFLSLMNYHNPIWSEKLRYTSFILFILVMFFLMLRFFLVINKIAFVAVMISAVASVACLLISPVHPYRATLPYVFLCMIFIAICFSIFYKVCNNIIMQLIVGVMICIVASFSTNNLMKTYEGYEKNAFIDSYNISVLEEYNGKDTEMVLLKYVNEEYRGPAAHDELFSATETWMKEYYNIPYEVEFVWKSIAE